MTIRDFIMRFIESGLFEVQVAGHFKAAYICEEDAINATFPVYFKEPGRDLNVGNIHTSSITVREGNGLIITFGDIDGVFYLDSFSEVYFKDYPSLSVVLEVKG